LRIVRLVESLPKTRTADVIGRQLLRCGTSVGANYRAACRARSRADFAAKMGIVEEEADETVYWIELLVDSNSWLRQMKLSLWLCRQSEPLGLMDIDPAVQNPQSEFRNPQSEERSDE